MAKICGLIWWNGKFWDNPLLDQHRHTNLKHQIRLNQPMNQQELEQHHAFSHMKLGPMLEYRQDCLLDNVTTGFRPKNTII